MKDEIKKYVGKKGMWHVHKSLKMQVVISNYKSQYGHDRFEVSPVAGEGTEWVENVELI